MLSNKTFRYSVKAHEIPDWHTVRPDQRNIASWNTNTHTILVIRKPSGIQLEPKVKTLYNPVIEGINVSKIQVHLGALVIRAT